MKKKFSLPPQVQHAWEAISGHQRHFVIYFLILALLFVFLPLIKITSLGTTQVDTFTLFNTYMTKTAVFIMVTILYMALYALSTRRQIFVHKVFGVVSNVYLTNM